MKMLGALVSSLFPYSGVSMLLVLLTIWVVTFVVIRYVLIKREEKVRGRKMSAMSELMSTRTFPLAAGDTHYVITNAIFVKELPERETVKKAFADHLLFYKRFRSIPQGSFWNECQVHLDEHVHSLEVDSQKALEEQIQLIMNRSIPTNKPRWEIFMIRNRELANSDALYEPSPTAKTSAPYHAMLIRVDHCIADGVSLVEVFSKLMTEFDGRPLSSSGLVGLKRGPPRKKTVSRFFMQAKFYSKIHNLLRIVKILIKVIKGIPTTLMMAIGPYDTATPFTATMEQKKKGITFSREQKVAYAGPWSLAYIKAVKAELGVSMNDLFMAAFAGAIRRYCLDQGDEQFSTSASKTRGELKHPVLCRALLPFAFLRNPKVFKDPEIALTNSWTLVSADFAVNENTRLDRAMKTQKIMTAIKKSLQPLANVLINTLGCVVLPRFLFQQTLWDTYNRHSVVFGNVPGAPSKVRFCGAVVEEVQILFCGDIPQVELFTYAGRVFFNLVASPDIVAHPEKVVEYFGDELRGFGRDLNIKDISLDFEAAADSPKKMLVTQSELSLGSASSSTESDAEESSGKASSESKKKE